MACVSAERACPLTEDHRALTREVLKPKKWSEDIPLPSNASAVEKLCLRTASFFFQLCIINFSSIYSALSCFRHWQTSNFRLEHVPSVLPLLPKFMRTNLNLQKSWAAPDMPTGTGLLTLFWPLPDRLWAERMLDHWSYITHLFFFEIVVLMRELSLSQEAAFSNALVYCTKRASTLMRFTYPAALTFASIAKRYKFEVELIGLLRPSRQNLKWGSLPALTKRKCWCIKYTDGLKP